jgi:hypothetical protein
VAPLRPPTLMMRYIHPRHCLNPFRFLVFDSETADEPISHVKPHVPLRRTIAQLLDRTTQSQLKEVRISADYLVEMFPSPT